MPIAGNNVSVMPMQVVNGKLVERSVTRVSSSMAQDPTEALDALKRGEVAYVKLYGHNVASVRSVWRTGAVEASE